MSEAVASAPVSTGGQNVPSGQNVSHQNVSQPTGVKEATPTSPAADPVREYKINGKMVKMSQREADDYVSMSYAAQERFNEAAKMRKEVESREQNYAKNPIQAMIDYCKKAGFNDEQTRQAIEDHYSKQYIEPETLSKEERALREREEKVKNWEKDQKERQLTQQQQQERKMTDDQIQNVTHEITSALDSAQLPKNNKFLVQRMAFYMHQNNQNGWNAPKEMILKQVVNEHKGIVGGFLTEATMDQILNYAGQEFIDKVLKYSLDKHRESRNKLQEPFVNDRENVPQNTGKIDMSEVNRRLRDMRTGKYMGAG